MTVNVGDGTYQDWSLVAAETIDGQNKVIGHQDGRMSEWNIDENWNYSSHNTIPLAPKASLTLSPPS